MYTQEQILDMYFNRNQQAVSATSQMSNTEPIIRVYSEASTMEAADELGKQIMDIVYSLAK